MSGAIAIAIVIMGLTLATSPGWFMWLDARADRARPPRPRPPLTPLPLPLSPLPGELSWSFGARDIETCGNVTTGDVEIMFVVPGTRVVHVKHEMSPRVALKLGRDLQKVALVMLENAPAVEKVEVVEAAK